MKKRIMTAIIIVAILITGLCIVASNPIVLHKNNVPKNYIEAIEDQAKGRYSKTLPLLPVCVTIDSFETETVYYTIHYFPFGTVGISYTESDGYNMEKALTGL